MLHLHDYNNYNLLDSRVDIERGSGVAATFTLRQYHTNKESPLLTGPAAIQLGYGIYFYTHINYFFFYSKFENELSMIMYLYTTGMYSVYVEDFMVRDVKYIWYNMSYRDLKKVLRENKVLRIFPLVDKHGKIDRFL